MDKLKKYDLHDAQIVSLTIERLNHYFSILLEIHLWDSINIRILFDEIDEYKITCGNVEQYYLEIDSYSFENDTYKFNLQGDYGEIIIKAKKIIIQK